MKKVWIAVCNSDFLVYLYGSSFLMVLLIFIYYEGLKYSWVAAIIFILATLVTRHNHGEKDGK